MSEFHIPDDIFTAVDAGDVQRLLRFWGEVVHPIPEETWGPQHPLFEVCCYVAYAIEDIGETLMTDEQRLLSHQRESFNNPALPYALA